MPREPEAVHAVAESLLLLVLVRLLAKFALHRAVTQASRGKIDICRNVAEAILCLQLSHTETNVVSRDLNRS